ncbi:hypothetical protein GCM10007415_34730 [Parapedobacter pyrenivorans]|uniref:Uncharacterized protein n=1 Tax=Parapedobacter pyrenivorans TaxID=1305674 RepID=A0A917HYT9_9SPHI|nr:hypothetical protein [Parapedobacter pyrenivorans]GGG96575.1 hypothetical protein GCM10007415_34730 [Parapedobacter pyrenivorans]
MLLHKLENIGQQVDVVRRRLENTADLNDDITALNSMSYNALSELGERYQRLGDSLNARRNLQEAIQPALELPIEARRMYVLDQLSFYERFVSEMMTFLTGSDYGRCISFSLSVEELLFFLRLVLEEQVMDAGALKPIFLFLSRHARTSGSDTLSYESLRKKYSAVGEGAKKRVAALMANLTDRAAHHARHD